MDGLRCEQQQQRGQRKGWYGSVQSGTGQVVSPVESIFDLNNATIALLWGLDQVQSRAETVPLPLEEHTLFFDAKNDPNNAEGRSMVDRFAYLGQDDIVTCDPEA